MIQPARVGARTPEVVAHQMEGRVGREIFLLTLISVIGCGACGNDPRGSAGPVMPNWPDTRDANLEVVDDGARLDVAPGDHGSDAGAIEEPVSSFGSDDGEPCESAEECASGACMPDPDWPEGYCTRRPCVADEECSAPDVVCSSFESERLCLLPCIGEGSCREGYWCAPSEDGDDRVCVPGQAPTPTGLADGEACASDEECLSKFERFIAGALFGQVFPVFARSRWHGGHKALDAQSQMPL